MATKNASDTARAKGAWQGMNWCRQSTRLAVYLRDGLACCYCGATLEDGTQLTLDHVLPASQGGTNATGNLVTACHKCNSVRQDRAIDIWAAHVAQYVNAGQTATGILAHVRDCLARELPRAEAKAMLARRKAAKAGAPC